jgi:hypothetical protein
MYFHIRHPLSSTLRRLRFPKDTLFSQGSRFHPRSLSRILWSGEPFRSRLGVAARRMSTSNQTESTSQPEYETFFRYTSGHWVWDEEQQFQDRYKIFNVPELQNVAAKAVGSDSCVSMIKLAEGGYNKVFRLLMDDGKTVIVRIPNPNAGPAFYTTASEVAMMELVG